MTVDYEHYNRLYARAKAGWRCPTFHRFQALKTAHA
jgi:hypothetical protein